MMFVVFAATDWFDGYLARRVLQTMLGVGAFLDPVADKFLVCACVLVLVHLQRDRCLCGAHHHWAGNRDLGLREWMAQIGAARSVAVHMIGQAQDHGAMVAIGFLLFDGMLLGLIDTHLWGARLIWVAAVMTVWSMVYYLRKRCLKSGHGAGGEPSAHAALIRAMPAVFVLIWSTGFIVARYGMPHAPPMKFLAVGFAVVHPAVSCPGSRWPVWLGPARRAAVGPSGCRRACAMHACYLGGVWSAIARRHGLRPCGTDCRLATCADRCLVVSHRDAVSRRQWLGLGLRLGSAGVGGLGQAGRWRRGQWRQPADGRWGPCWASPSVRSIKKYVLPCDVRSADASFSSRPHCW